MKINPEKYIFGVSSGKFLGFIVSHRGIEANLRRLGHCRVEISSCLTSKLAVLKDLFLRQLINATFLSRS